VRCCTPSPASCLWDAGDPYDLNLVLAGGVLLLDRRDDRVVFVVEAGDFVGELGMLMGQRAFLPGVAMEGTTLLRVRVEELRRLMEISGELSDVLLAAFDARRRRLNRIGEGGLVLAGDAVVSGRNAVVVGGATQPARRPCSWRGRPARSTS
jgi:thioredoxin reductase (NADPH)